MKGALPIPDPAQAPHALGTAVPGGVLRGPRTGRTSSNLFPSSHSQGKGKQCIFSWPHWTGWLVQASVADRGLVSLATRSKCLPSHLQQGWTDSSTSGALTQSEARAWLGSEDPLAAKAALHLVKQSLFPDGIVWQPLARAASRKCWLLGSLLWLCLQHHWK